MELDAYIVYGKKENPHCEECFQPVIIFAEIDLEELEQERYKYENGIVGIRFYDDGENFEDQDELSANKILWVYYLNSKEEWKYLDCMNTYRFCWEKKTNERVLCKDRVLPKTTLDHINRGKIRKNNKRHPTKYEKLGKG